MSHCHRHSHRHWHYHCYCHHHHCRHHHSTKFLHQVLNQGIVLSIVLLFLMTISQNLFGLHHFLPSNPCPSLWQTSAGFQVFQSCCLLMFAHKHGRRHFDPYNLWH